MDSARPIAADAFLHPTYLPASALARAWSAAARQSSHLLELQKAPALDSKSLGAICHSSASLAMPALNLTKD